MERTALILMCRSAVLVFAATISGESIGDFAPMETGAVREYQYNYEYSSSSLGFTSETLSIKIDLFSREIAGADSLIILRIIENGTLRYWGSAMRKDTTKVISKDFMDTVIVRGDSILQSAGYQCPVFPFHTSHEISLDSLKPFSFSGNDLLAYTFNWGIGKAIYLQDVGLYSLQDRVEYTSGRGNITVSLVSYTGKSPPVALRPASRECYRSNRFASSGYSKIVVPFSPPVSDLEKVSLAGRRMSTVTSAAACLGIQRCR